MAQTLWSYSSSGRYDSKLFGAITQACLSNMSGLSACPPALDTIVGALARSGHYDMGFFDEVTWQVRRYGGNMSWYGSCLVRVAYFAVA